MTDIGYRELIKVIEEMPINIPFTGTAKDMQIYINAYLECQSRIVELIKEPRMDGKTDENN